MIQTLLVLFVLFLASCSKDTKYFTEEDAFVFESNVSGLVQNKQGPMSGVLVVASPGGYTTITGNDGRYSLGGLRSGHYLIQFLKEDYRDSILSDSLYVGLREALGVNPIKLKYRYASIKGSVVDETGEAQIGAGIVVEDQPGGTISQTSGKFSISNVEPGKIRLFSVLQGVGYGYADVNLESDSIYTNVKISLDKRGGVVMGTVVDTDGNPVSKASIDAFQGAIQTTTNSAGEFMITEIPKDGANRIHIGKGDDQTFCGGMNLDGTDTLRIGTIVLDEMPEAQIVLPNTTHFTSTSDTSVLVLPWTSESDSVVPLWYYWSFDDGDSWITTTEPMLQIIPAQLGWKAGNYWVKVRCSTKDSLESNIASITVTVNKGIVVPGASSSSSYNSSQANLSSQVNLSSQLKASSVSAASSNSYGGKPKIEIGPLDSVSVCLGKRYVEPGYTALDYKDSNITASVIVDSSQLNINTVGTYPIYYNVAAPNGFADTAIRIVKVERWAYLTQGLSDSIIIDDFENSNGNWMSKDTSTLISNISTIRLAEGLPVHNYFNSIWFAYSDQATGGNSYHDPSFGGDRPDPKPKGDHRVVRSIAGTDTNFAEHVTFYQGTMRDSLGVNYGGVGVSFFICDVGELNCATYPPTKYIDGSSLQAVGFDAKGSGTICAHFESDILWKDGNDGWGNLEKCFTLTSTWTRYTFQPSDLTMADGTMNQFTWSELAPRINNFAFSASIGGEFDLYLDNLVFYGIPLSAFLTSLSPRYILPNTQF